MELHPVFSSDLLKMASEAYFNEDWAGLQDINLSMLSGNENNEFLIWHIADTFIRMGDVSKALEFAERLPEGDVHRDDIFLKAAHIENPDPDMNVDFKNRA